MDHSPVSWATPGPIQTLNLVTSVKAASSTDPTPRPFHSGGFGGAEWLGPSAESRREGWKTTSECQRCSLEVGAGWSVRHEPAPLGHEGYGMATSVHPDPGAEGWGRRTQGPPASAAGAQLTACTLWLWCLGWSSSQAQPPRVSPEIYGRLGCLSLPGRAVSLCS